MGGNKSTAPGHVTYKPMNLEKVAFGFSTVNTKHLIFPYLGK